MAGIYIHIPFCKQACHYCDFHFSTNLKSKEKVISALLKEIKLRAHYLAGEQVETIYFGGGTPSLLSENEISSILSLIHQLFQVNDDAEITLEANPDDLNEEAIIRLASSKINRLSIGIQSFRDEDLKLMNRAHSAKEALASLKASQKAGFRNITIDLIYGIPNLSNNSWQENIQKALDLGIPHISAYSLTVEEKTALKALIEKGEINSVSDKQTSEQFEILMLEMKRAGFEHYEISNFAKPNFRSKHNSSYWSGKKYLGIGPSAHSYNGNSRQWNVSNNHIYAGAIESGKLDFEDEYLSNKDRFNEFILTRLRLVEGIDLKELEQNFGIKNKQVLLESASRHITNNFLKQSENYMHLTQKGKFFADKIASDLFL